MTEGIADDSVLVELCSGSSLKTETLLRKLPRSCAYVPVDVSVSDVALVASGELVLNRRDYGMVYNSIVNPVGNEVRVSFTIRARAS